MSGGKLRWCRACAAALLVAAHAFHLPALAQPPAAAPHTAAPAAAAAPSAAPTSAAPAVFALEVQAPAPIAALLRQHLELVRYTHLSDLDAVELQRLVTAADAQARQLLATQGHFAPHIDWATQAQPTGPAWRVTAVVTPGPQAHIASVQWQFEGHMAQALASDKTQTQGQGQGQGQTQTLEAAQQLQALQAQWGLPVGRPFTQAQWQQAKADALRDVTAQRYPLGRWRETEARVNPDDHSVALHLHMDSGPEVRLGPLVITGHTRYDAASTQRLANLPAGQPYRLHDVLEAQQRLVLSGFFDAVFVSLDTDGPPEAMPVRIELQEAPRQRWQWGVGLRSDTGPRLTLEHTHHRVPGLDWRATTKLALDRSLQSVSAELLSPPNERLWRFGLQAKAEQQTFANSDVSSQRLRAGRQQHTEATERSHYAQFDRAQTHGSATSTLSALSAHTAWTWRRFDSLPFPTRGWGLGLELGTGVTLTEGDTPYLRALLKSLQLWPVGSHGHRLALRTQVGAVGTHHVERIPSTQLFVAGGEGSVRGYAPGAIGAVHTAGTTTPGRYLLTGSAEWIAPIRQAQQRTDWDALAFVDAGRVANDTARGPTRIGTGVGVRWKSPVGPFEIDLARALATSTDKGQWRLHMSIGFRL